MWGGGGVGEEVVVDDSTTFLFVKSFDFDDVAGPAESEELVRSFDRGGGGRGEGGEGGGEGG